jgi:hypothetical protein
MTVLHLFGTWDARKIDGRDNCEVITAKNALRDPRTPLS